MGKKQEKFYGDNMNIFRRKPNIDALEKKKNIEKLVEALENSDGQIRFKAIGALGRLKASQA
jgi:hypothetical protein